MSSDSSSTQVNMTKIGIAGRKKQTKKHQKHDSDSDDEKPAKDIVQAAKNVAQKLGGNPNQTEAELLSKLISHSDQSNEITKELKNTMNLK